MIGLIMRKDKILALCSSWEFQAKKQFLIAEEETNERERRGFIHGAAVYYHIARELRDAVHTRFGFSFIPRNKLSALCAVWTKRGRNRFYKAETGLDEMGKRVLEHGAVIYYNALQELRAAMHAESGFDFIFKAFRRML